MATYEIPTANGYKTVKAKTKAEAVSSVTDAVLNKPRNVKGVNFVTPDNVPTQAFDSSKNISIKPQATSTGAQGMSAQIESMAKTNQDTFTRNLEERAKQLEADRATSKDMYLQSLLGSQGENQLTQEAYAKTVDPLEQELTDINNQIMAEQNAVRRRLQELDKNPQGLFGGALQDEKNRVERESLAKQADLSVIQMARQGKYDSAKEIADRAIQVKLEQQKTINEALKFNYEENKDLFTKAEQRAFESAQADRNRKLDREERDLKEISDLSLSALQNGAPTSVATRMRNAKTPQEAMSIAGSYLISFSDKIKQAELKKLNVPQPEIALDIDNKIKSIEEIKGNSLGLKLAVGPTRLNRTAGAIDLTSGGLSARQNFIASVEQLTSEETLNTLINAKAKGATFGALSEGELNLLRQSASKIGKWAITKDGKVVGYKASESDFLKELNRLQSLQKKAYERSTGIKYGTQNNQSFSIDPATGNLLVDVPVDDNTFWGVTQ